MRSLSRSTFVVIAALMLGVAFAATSAMAQQTANDAAGRRFSNKLAITEFRADGPGGTSDEYVELCNVSDNTFTILRDTGETGVAVTGIGVYSFQQSTNNIVKLFAVKDGVVFQPGQCFLGAGTGYSLSTYTPTGVATAPSGATPDITFSNVVCNPDGTGCSAPGATTDGIETDTGVAIFGTDDARFGVVGGLPAVCLSGGCVTPGPSTGLATIEDAIGFNVVNTITFPGVAAPNSPIFREGAGLTPINAVEQQSRTSYASPGVIPQYAWVRRSCGVNPSNGVKSATSTPGTCTNPFAGPNGTVGTNDKEGVIQDTDNNNNDHFGLEVGGNVATNQGGTVTRSGQPVAPGSTVDKKNGNPGPTIFSDFFGVLTPNSSSPGPVTAILGAAGPESFTGDDHNPGVRTGAPRKRRFGSGVVALNFTTSALDTSAAAANTIPNRERVSAVPRPGNRADGTVVVPADNNEASAPLGTFALRFTIRNTTNQVIGRLRWRLMDGTVDNRPQANEVFVAGQPMAVLRLISSTTSRVFVATGSDQNCSYANPTPAGATACGGSGFKLVQGTVLDSSQPQGTAIGNNPGPAGNCGTTVGSPCNPGGAGTVNTGAPIGGGINHSVNVENNTIAGSGAGVFPNNAGVGNSAGNPNRGQGIPRGNGSINLATPLASGDAISVEFRFGVQTAGRFYLMIEPEADNGVAAP